MPAESRESRQSLGAKAIANLLHDFRTLELETALIDDCDYGTLRNICKGRPVPEHLRQEVWQVSRKYQSV